MKTKRSAVTNNNTGYRKPSKSHVHRSKNDFKEIKKEQQNLADDANEDLNSGFGDYLRSPQAVEMMKLFVFANSIMLILTLAWPNIKDQYYLLRNWMNS